MGSMVIQKIKVCPALSDKEVTATRKTGTSTANPKKVTFILVCRRRFTIVIAHDEMSVV